MEDGGNRQLLHVKHRDSIVECFLAFGKQLETLIKHEEILILFSLVSKDIVSAHRLFCLGMLFEGKRNFDKNLVSWLSTLLSCAS
jgi:hypothetical protein